ncbi:hypothetical protein GUITHDRAFT_117730 [Guillardia theta CCMP2712]|uniref:Uncharacterized protein n=1 Tax=Guillardia theta (strain CCMP2712) TaxID=905079 RepID=L1III1_GUITC|nr:hypothetical protein GUITHDRAFT_117730 [Guillardia theta CCMP2712]EKX36063.1 hypothetical protein GUITHDRAFT_117730 [Guillardia theta CCMP2712]|eukprot:XP_005823043.1 hypothetical protein GUITHDRAFT_117730 [Guillardia theta CCMP2712]
MEVRLSGIDDARVLVLFNKFAIGRTSRVGLVKDASNGLVTLEAWLNCLKHLNYVPEKMDEADAIEIFRSFRQASLNLGFFRSSLQMIVRKIAQSDLVKERRKRFSHFEQMQNRQLLRELDDEVSSRDRLVKMKDRFYKADATFRNLMEERKKKLTERLAYLKQKHDDQIRHVEAYRERIEEEKRLKAEKKKEIHRELMEKLARDKEQQAAINQFQQAVKEDLKMRHLEQVARSQEYKRSKLMAKLEKKAKVPLEMASHKAAFREEQAMDHFHWKIQKDKLEVVKADLRWKGKLVGLPKELESYSVLRSFLHNQKLNACLDDLSPELPPVQEGEWIPGRVEKDLISSYKLFLSPDSGQCTLRIELKLLQGLADVYVGNGTLPFPTQQEYHWSSCGLGAKRLAIQFFDHHFMLGYFYISVLGTKNAFQSCCEYELRWDCRKLQSPLAEVGDMSKTH